jgi:glycosyltransferase involved in cell wall biosynthesis
MPPKYSVIVPVYNRPDEVNELLASLVEQHYKNFEVVIVEDGSSIACKEVVDRYQSSLSIQYFVKANGGPGPARNYGYERAVGNYFVAFDSDCIIPTGYFDVVEEALLKFGYDAWGGPDRAHERFTAVQRAMGYTMSSILTTGGIRGGKKRVGWFQPRSFNMGISRKVFEKTGGFLFNRFAEDIELSFRMRDAGFRVGLIENAYVYHKRRTNFSQFFRQVFNFGKGRILIGRAHAGGVKLAHWFPSVFTLGLVALVLLPFVRTTLSMAAACGAFIYFTSIFIHSLIVNRDVKVALLSVPSALVQLTGYGLGFLSEWIKGIGRSRS